MIRRVCRPCKLSFSRRYRHSVCPVCGGTLERIELHPVGPFKDAEGPAPLPILGTPAPAPALEPPGVISWIMSQAEGSRS